MLISRQRGLRLSCVALDDAIQHLDRTPYGVGDTVEFDETSVAGALHHAPVVYGDCWVNELLRSARSRVSVRSSSVPASRLYPTTSATVLRRAFSTHS